MEKKPTPEKTETKELNIMLPEELIKRIYLLCDERGMTIQEFVTDAIIEKLQLAHKERRKKGRL
ncbi:MAG: hypothetical protein JRE61_15850 [Deltaproteobacteria bacterium]|nr:hypothetical protein [Deltaproteobacteria bacterium]